MDDLRAIYGQIAGNKSVNESIYVCMDILGQTNATRILNRLKKLSRNIRKEDGTIDFLVDRQCLDAYREILTGAFLTRSGFSIVYSPNVNGKTPDWGILRSEGGMVERIVDNVSFHPASGNGKGDRLFSSLDNKAGAYARLAKEQQLPYVIALFGSFFVGLYDDDVKKVLEKDLTDRQWLSGILFLEDSGRGGYRFTSLPNPTANLPFDLPSGELDPLR